MKFDILKFPTIYIEREFKFHKGINSQIVGIFTLNIHLSEYSVCVQMKFHFPGLLIIVISCVSIQFTLVAMVIHCITDYLTPVPY